MSLSGLTMAVGILESDLPDIFGDALVAVSSWDASYYTLSGSDLTALANRGQGSALNSFNWTSADLVSDGDGTDWFTDPLDGIAGAELLTLATADDDAIFGYDEGIITLESYRAKADQSNATGALETSGIDIDYDAEVFWRNLRSSSAGLARSDLEFYHQITGGLHPAPYTGAASYVGMLKDDPAFPGDGEYDPDGNTLTTPAYTTGDDIVVSWFLQPTGIRCMVNGAFVALQNARYRNADGTASDEAAEASTLALDWTPKAQYANQGGSGGRNLRLNIGAQTKTDYMGVFRGNRLDSYVSAAHSILLNGKPT